jgi:predicted RNase H-like HicB family nuclease
MEEKNMQFIYPAVFSKREDGGYRGYFPDLEQCYAEGDTLDEALNGAIEEARTWIQVELEDTFELPPVSHPDSLDLQEGEFVRNIAVTIRLTDGWDE